MPMPCWKLALLFGVLACSQGLGKHDGGVDTQSTEFDGQAVLTATPDAGEVGAPSTASACRTDKIDFSQETGCRNDNAVEFCIPANDTLAESQVIEIAPTVECSRGGGGRAGCKTGSERLCQLPLPRERCPWSGSMPDDLWLAVCRISALDAVTRIVPTYYE